MHVDLVWRALHLMGAIFWVGGLSVLALAAATVDAPAAAHLRKLALRVATPAMVVTFVFGLLMLVPHFSEHYVHAGWMHAKLVLVLAASGLSGAITGRLRKLAAGDAGPGPLRVLGIVLGALGVLIVALAILKPF